MKIKDLMTTEQAADFLGISKSALDQLCQRRQVPFYKCAKRRRFDQKDLEAFVKGSRIEAGAVNE